MTTVEKANEAIKLLKYVPNGILFEEAKKRRVSITEKLGKHGIMKKMTKCLGCGQTDGARWLRTHHCSVSATLKTCPSCGKVYPHKRVKHVCG